MRDIVHDACAERLGLLPVRWRSVKDAQVEQHPVGARRARGSDATPCQSRRALTARANELEDRRGSTARGATVSMSRRPTDCEAMRRLWMEVNPIASAPGEEALHVSGQRTGDDLSPKAREFAGHQVVVTGLEPPWTIKKIRNEVVCGPRPVWRASGCNGPVLWCGQRRMKVRAPWWCGVAPAGANAGGAATGEEVARRAVSGARAGGLGQHRTRPLREQERGGCNGRSCRCGHGRAGPA